MATVSKRRRRLTNGMAFAVLVMVFAVIILWNRMVFTTPVGHASIVWHRLFWGGERRSLGPMSEGLHIILPWDKFYTYDVRLQSSDQAYEVVSRDGLHLEITLTFRWRAQRAGIVELNENIGPNYLNTLLIPVVGSVAREVIARHDADKLFSVERGSVQDEIYRDIVSQNHPNGIGSHRATEADDDNLINLEDVLIKRVKLPPQLRAAIEQKLEQAQKVQEYAFRAKREKYESDRKAIEAQGIRRFQEIVTPAISESYLRWRGIEATLKLAESKNTKVVVIGNSANGLPLILDTRTELPAEMASVPAAVPDVFDGKIPDPSLPETRETPDPSQPVSNPDGSDLETGNPPATPTEPADRTGDIPSQKSPPTQSRGVPIEQP
ncbi:prohibitin family protein [Imhoffiella purpurea]|uniref:SPFH/band 7 domain protein n=1 Tax=Imhoffiella purpurea TaxID=1249627 RepID=W9V9R4_9GAMM|nr:prohibitin family protein [Imhoffiella purpurea]EXJ16194.1 SPFH/band 7 domain protein [Imhoffiella purpurea]